MAATPPGTHPGCAPFAHQPARTRPRRGRRRSPGRVAVWFWCCLAVAGVVSPVVGVPVATAAVDDVPARGVGRPVPVAGTVVCDATVPDDPVRALVAADARLDATALVAPRELGAVLSAVRELVAARREALAAVGWDPAALDPAGDDLLVQRFAAPVAALRSWWSTRCGAGTRPSPAVEALTAAGLAPVLARCVAAEAAAFPDVSPAELTAAFAACGADPSVVAPPPGPTG